MRNLFSLLLLYALSIQLLSAQDSWQISGKIIGEEDDLPVVGANIIVKGTTQGTISDIDGYFTLSVKPNSTLQVSMIGFKIYETAIKSPNTNLNIVLEPDNYILDEIVSVGYGTMKKSDLTGAVASVNSEDLQKTPAAGLDQALQGKVAGVTVNANSGQPGSAAVVRIRGIGTVNNSAPIYVV
ncbi:SusC/RagA family TonB-linked outer membrane protein, partial [Labilibacter sediminis]